MQKSFPLLLRQLHLSPKFFKENDILKVLSESDFEELKNLGLLKRTSDLTHVTCESCDEPHSVPVKCEDQNPYISCASDSKSNYLEPSSIRRWAMDVGGFLQSMTTKLGIDDRIESLDVDDLWLLGTIVKDHIPNTCFFYHGKNMEAVSEFLTRQRNGSERQIVITSSKIFTEDDHQFLTFDVGLLVELRAGSLHFNKKVFEQYLNALRLVQFDSETGSLSVGGEPIITIPLNTPQYYFAAILWEKFGEPQPNTEIAASVSKSRNRKQKYDRDSNQVCYDLKSKIKLLAEGNERKQKILDEVFAPAPVKGNQNGFVMRNPNL